MWPLRCLYNPNPAPNAIVRVPVKEILVYVYKKERKYVNLNDRETEILKCKNGWMENFMSKFRPKTPPGMGMLIEKRHIKKLTITIYKKKRISIPVELHEENVNTGHPTAETAAAVASAEQYED